MFVVGLTGGIGSGKSTVANYFAQLGISVIDADIIARLVVEKGTNALQQIAMHFGQEILLPNGTLDRGKLRSIIFNNPKQKDWLEALLHPLIAKETSRQIQSADGDYCLFVSPLLLETSQHQLCNKILVVDASEQLQLDRTLARDSSNEKEIHRIIASQIDRQSRLNKADDVIENNGDLKALNDTVISLHHHYLSLAKKMEAAQ